MTNLEKWQSYTQHLFTTDTYVEFGWLFTVTAALQRRVWYGKLDGMPLFPNLYGCFVGPPAVGKGLVLGEVEKFAQHHKTVKGYEGREDKANDVEKARNMTGIIRTGPSDTTYQAYLKSLSEGIIYSRLKFGEKTSVYGHNSMVFILEELDSLFKKDDNCDRLIKMLLTAYDCKPYHYKTKHEGEDIIKAPCVGILAGTTPENLGKLFARGILTDGFLSRMLLIFESVPRKSKFFLDQPDEVMDGHKSDILAHILDLTKVSGQLMLEPGLVDKLESWWENVHLKHVKAAPIKLDSYLSRKRVQVQKLAAAYHFSEHTDMVITWADFEKALNFLTRVEPNMAYGLTMSGRNEMSKMSKGVLRYIEGNPEGNMVSLFCEFQSEVTLIELRTIMDELVFLGKIKVEGDKYTLR